MATKGVVMNDKLSYATAVFNRDIVIRCNDKSKYKFLKSIEARRFLFGSTWYVHYRDDSELASYFNKLREAGFLFSYDQHGWGPSAIFQYLREKGLLQGMYTEIYWTGLNEYHTRKL